MARQELLTQQFGGRNLPRRTEMLGSSFRSGGRQRRLVHEFGKSAERLEQNRPHVNASISNAVDRQSREIAGVASTAVQQRFGDQQTGAVTQRDTLDKALKRAKARQGIRLRGEDSARNQQLTDRLAQARSGIKAKGRAIRQVAAGQNVLAGVDIGIGDAQARIDAARADAFGTTAGAFAAFGKEKFGSSSKPKVEKPHNLATDGF